MKTVANGIDANREVVGNIHPRGSGAPRFSSTPVTRHRRRCCPLLAQRGGVVVVFRLVATRGRLIDKFSRRARRRSESPLIFRKRHETDPSRLTPFARRLVNGVISAYLVLACSASRDKSRRSVARLLSNLGFERRGKETGREKERKREEKQEIGKVSKVVEEEDVSKARLDGRKRAASTRRAWMRYRFPRGRDV